MVGKTYPITFRLVNNELKTTGSFDVGQGEQRAYSETWRKVEMAKP
ncbi:MAG: hypothetical protein INR69_11665 [Mucilaginibacter polytrichastri]|nr:hypothetical protein [Mucilaginibacter polytrichastri]